MGKYGISTYGAVTGLSASTIKNLALFELGFPDEIDFSDSTNATVKKVDRIYNTCLLFVLSNYPWRFIYKRVQLTSKTDATDINKFKYNYTVPGNMLVTRNIYYDAGYSSPIRDFESNPNYINTDATTVYLWYSAIVDETEFPQYFIDYFKYKLALDLCFNLTGDTDLLKLLAVQELKMLLTSKNIDAKQVQTRTIRNSPFTAIRR